MIQIQLSKNSLFETQAQQNELKLALGHNGFAVVVSKNSVPQKLLQALERSPKPTACAISLENTKELEARGIDQGNESPKGCSIHSF